MTDPFLDAVQAFEKDYDEANARVQRLIDDWKEEGRDPDVLSSVFYAYWCEQAEAAMSEGQGKLQ